MCFDVGGTATNIDVIRNGRPAIDYSIVGKYPTFISSLDVRVLGCAGGSVVRAGREGVIDVTPVLRPYRGTGLECAVFHPREEIGAPRWDCRSRASWPNVD